MNEKELAKRLMDLAACYDYAPQKAAMARYLWILKQWKLSPAQWEKLGDLAVLRLTRKFPMPGELYDIASELKEQDQLRTNTELMVRIREEWKRQAEGAAE